MQTLVEQLVADQLGIAVQAFDCERDVPAIRKARIMIAAVLWVHGGCQRGVGCLKAKGKYRDNPAFRRDVLRLCESL